MCTFCSDLKLSQRGEGSKKSPITLFLKPNDPNNEKEKYRFRILNYRSPAKSGRTTSFITRYVHTHWGVNDKGNKVVDDTVVCPMTEFVDSKGDPTLGFTDIYHELKLKGKRGTIDEVCPVCKHAAESWNAAKASGYKDRTAMQRINELKRQFQAIVPVYVINDPVNEKNNGRFKCIIFTNKDEFNQFSSLINMEVAKIQSKFSATGEKYDWCNGKYAVDFYLRMDVVKTVTNPGTPKERTINMRKITKMGFGSTPYDLVDDNQNPIITQEAIDAFEFDDQYFTKSTFEDLNSFYKKNYGVISKNIPTEEDDVFGDVSNQVASTPTPTSVSIPSNPTRNAPVAEPIPSEKFDELINDPDDIGLDAQQPTNSNSIGMEDDTEAILSHFNFTT